MDLIGLATVLAVGGAIAYGVHHVRRRLIQRDARAEEVWALLAKEYGLTYTHALTLDDRIVERQVSGQLTGLAVRIEQATCSVSDRRTTSIRVSLDAWPYPPLTIQRKGDARGPGLPTGDAQFDADGAVACADADFASAVLTAEVRARLLDLWANAGAARFTDGKLVWRVPGVVAERKALDGTLARALEAMRALRRGTASLPASAQTMAG